MNKTISHHLTIWIISKLTMFCVREKSSIVEPLIDNPNRIRLIIRKSTSQYNLKRLVYVDISNEKDIKDCNLIICIQPETFFLLITHLLCAITISKNLFRNGNRKIYNHPKKISFFVWKPCCVEFNTPFSESRKFDVMLYDNAFSSFLCPLCSDKKP